uniref:Vesicle-associated membrane protein 4 n=1 Tax=Gadus morhua TaxID=8049 RepID=A0A8C5BMD7_GADMO
MPPKFKRHLNDEEVTGSIRSERGYSFMRAFRLLLLSVYVCVCVCVRVQSQVDEVIDVMQENISKVIERGERLEDLQDKSESLSDNASAFSSRAKQLHRRMWWRDMKMKIIISLVVFAVLLIIIGEYLVKQ